MDADVAKRTARINVTVSEDRLKAWVHRPSVTDPDYRPPTAEEICGALEAARIVVTEEVRARVAQFVALCAAHANGERSEPPPPIPEKFLVAEGRSPTEPTDEQFEPVDAGEEPASADPDAGSIDYFLMSSIRTVEAGVVIGRLIPPREGVPGEDVFGQALPPRRRSGSRVKLGPGLEVLPDSLEVVTAVPGRVRRDRNRIWLEELLEIHGDVDFDTGSLDVCVNVVVHGTVKSRFRVRTTKSLSVKRTVEAATVEVGGDVLVAGGVFGRECQGSIRAGGTVGVRFCDEAVVVAGGDFQFANETLNSHVETTGRIVSERGTLIGGRAWAREGIEVGTLGSVAGVATRVAVGMRLEALRQLRALDEEAAAYRKAAEAVEEKLQPYVANAARLSPRQREIVAEWTRKAATLRAQAEEVEQRKAGLLEAERPRGKPYVLAHAVIHPGVRLAIGPRMTRITTTIEGPVKIEERKVRDVTEMVAVHESTGTVTILRSLMLPLDRSAEDEEAEAEGTAEE